MSSAWMDATAQDIRCALRNWVRTPMFAVAAMGILALAIGANTAIVTIASGVLVRPLPFARADDLVQLSETQPRTAAGLGWDGAIVYQDFEQWRTRSTRLDGMLTYQHTRMNLLGPDGPEPVIAVAAEPGLFGMLGVAALIGRTFDEHDPANVAVVSYGYWKAHFEGDPAAIGRRLTIDGQAFTLIGIMPRGFEFPYRASSTGLFDAFSSTAIWIPRELPADLRAHPERRMDSVIARIKRGVTLEAARAELASMPGPADGHRLVRVTPLKDVVSGPARQSLLVLLGAVGLVLLVACANVASLLLVRSASRSSEMALRAALGASRGRLIRQLLTESLLMALIAGAIGLAIGAWGSRLLVRVAASHIPRAQEIGLDWPVFTFLLVASIATGLAFGVAPAITASRASDTAMAIRRRGVAATLRSALVVAEIAVAFVLLAGAGLLLRTFLNLQQTHPGLDADNVVTAHIFVADAAEAMAIEARVTRIPGVRAAGLISLLPLQNSGWRAAFTIAGRPELHETELRYITPGYFRAMGIPLRAGREFSPHDDAGAPRVILVNEALARAYFPGENPVGRQTDRGTIVGVAGDVRQDTLRQPATPEIYYAVTQNFAQIASHGSTLVVRVDRTPTALVGAIRMALREVSPTQGLFRVETMQSVIEESLADTRLSAWLVSLFAAMGLLLAMVGIYGVIAYLVALRTREFGIRMALGADAGHMRRLVLGHGARLTAFGVITGILLALAATRVLRGALYGVAATDPITFVAMTMILATAALAAYAIPARRAARIDPSIALRDEST